MTVKQLMNKLKEIPENYEIVLDNNELFLSGVYKAIGIDIDEYYKQVEIVTDHLYRWSHISNRWVK